MNKTQQFLDLLQKEHILTTTELVKALQTNNVVLNAWRSGERHIRKDMVPILIQRAADYAAERGKDPADVLAEKRNSINRRRLRAERELSELEQLERYYYKETTPSQPLIGTGLAP